MIAEIPAGMPVAAVIVVAGGRSTRFGSDKLRHVIHGRTLLDRTTAAAAVVAPVVLVTAEDAPPERAPERVVAVSEFPRWGGPCAAVAAGLDAVTRDGDVLVVPADLADPVSALEALAAIADGVLTDPAGHPQWLLARAPLARLRTRLTALRSSGDGLHGRPASALFGALAARHPATSAACADIDTPADLPGGSAAPTAAAAIDEEEPAHGTV